MRETHTTGIIGYFEVAVIKSKLIFIIKPNLNSAPVFGPGV